MARTPTPGGDGCYCVHHPDDPAHGPECYEPSRGFAPCPYCVESCGYLGDHSRGYDGAECFTPSNRPCPECNGTGNVECEPRTLDDLESEDWAPDTSAWVESIHALAHPALVGEDGR